MKKKFKKSFFYGIYFFAVFVFLFLIFYLPAKQGNRSNEHPERESQQQIENLKENEGRFESVERDVGEKEYYLGIYAGQIAVYEKELQGDFVLKEVLPYPVNKVYYKELEKGIPFSSEEEKNLLLENYTS